MPDIPELADRLIRETTLSERESLTVTYRADGLSWAEIADRMDIERDTAEGYYERARQKYRRAENTVTLLEEIGFVDG